MNRNRGIIFLWLFLIAGAGTAHGGDGIELGVALHPNTFPPGQVSWFLACISNRNPASEAKILRGDAFRIMVGSAAGMVLSTGAVLVDSTQMVPGDFIVGSGTTANDIFLSYVGAAKDFDHGESFCVEISFQASEAIGPFEVAVDLPGRAGRLRRYEGPGRLFTLGSIIDFTTWLSGAQGPQGLQGPQGPTGPQGPQGIPGPQGESGAPGPQGPAGVQGAAGPEGPAGAAGAQGPPGAPGPQGPAGTDGTSITFQGEWNPVDNYLANQVVTYLGETWIAVVANANSEPLDVSAEWSKLAAKGADGAAGAQGLQGPAGPQGPQGETGPQGPQGPQGIQGPAGAQGAAGAAGAQGPEGPQGPAGPQGAQGPSGTGATIIGGGTGNANLAGGANRFVAAFFSHVNATENVVDQAMAVGGTVSNLYIRLDGSPGSSGSYTFTVRKNGADTTLGCMIPESATSCSDTDAAHSVSFNAGDLLAIKAVPTSSPSGRGMRWSAKFAPD
jgi:hypothetical protein